MVNDGGQEPVVNLSRPWTGRRMHLIGLGGAGMSGYARAAHALGAAVSGSDRHASDVLARLEADGVATVTVGHAAANLPGGDDLEVYHSSAIARENPERAGARARGLIDLPRAELLAQLSRLRRVIAVAGAHGKTTTSAMIAHVLLGVGSDPSYLIGGTLRSTHTNAHWGAGQWLVVEADESDRSMLALSVDIAVLTNVELDHHATYRSLQELRDAFAAFLSAAPDAVVWDRADLLELRGEGPVAAYEAEEVRLAAGGSRFRWRGQEVDLGVPGIHNARNAVAALEACRLAGASPQRAASALASFTGAARRFERLGETGAGAVVYDDYAHHPTEIAATLEAARTLSHRRLIAVFQPHLYSRTAMLARELGVALARADVAAVLDVYPARERGEDFPGVSGRLVAQATADAAAGRPVYWLADFAQAPRVLGGLLEPEDLVVVMGAGDIDVLGRELVV